MNNKNVFLFLALQISSPTPTKSFSSNNSPFILGDNSSNKRSRSNDEEKDVINESVKKTSIKQTEDEKDLSKNITNNINQEEDLKSIIPSDYIDLIVEQKYQELKIFMTPPFNYSTETFTNKILLFLKKICSDYDSDTIFNLNPTRKIFLFISKIKNSSVNLYIDHNMIIGYELTQTLKKYNEIKGDTYKELSFFIKFELKQKEIIFKKFNEEKKTSKKLYELSQIISSYNQTSSYLTKTIKNIAEDTTEFLFLLQDSAMQSIIYQCDKDDDFKFSIIKNIKHLMLIFYLNQVILKNSKELCKIYSESDSY